MASIESKRVQYRKYLERAGVIDALSKALIKLYEEQNKPDDAIRFVRKFMCESCPDDDQYDSMKNELDEANRTIANLEQTVERLRSLIKKTPEEIAAEVDEHYKSLMEDTENTTSLLRKHLTPELLEELKPLLTSPPVEASILDCAMGGFKHHDAIVGIYAADRECYDVFNKLFDPIIRELHGIASEADVGQVDIDWGNVDEIQNLDAERKYILSTRIRIARNLEGYPFFPKLRENDYSEIEEKVKTATEALEGEQTGVYTSMADLEPDVQSEMVKRNVLFNRDDPYLMDAGCYRFWPKGRGVYNNPSESFFIWVNAEDHLRIISMAKCGDIGDVYNRLVTGYQQIEKNLQFMPRHPQYGGMAASPKNLGTTLRASVHMRLPLLSKNPEQLQTLSNDFNLQLRGTGGENSPIVDGIMDVSNKKRLGMSEFELVKLLQDGVIALINAEQQLAENAVDN